VLNGLSAGGKFLAVQLRQNVVLFGGETAKADIFGSEKDQLERDVTLAGEADRQKRKCDAPPCKTFIITGISEPFD